MTSKKPFLILQLRPEDAASDNEYSAFLQFSGLIEQNTTRIRIEKHGVPKIDLDKFSGVIVGGGPSNVSDHNKPVEQIIFEAELAPLIDEIIQRDFPFLGACYGLGLLANHLGGVVSKEKYGEPVGAIGVMLTPDAQTDALTKDLPPTFRAFAGHKEACQDTPPGAVVLAKSDSCPVQMIRYGQNVYATQFHPELDREGLALRINIYRHAGYFPPEDAEMLITASKDEDITEPGKILRRFVNIYKK